MSIRSVGWIAALSVLIALAGWSWRPGHVGASRDASEELTWKDFQADSGYRISYPLELYSARNAPSPSEVLYPGVKAFEPNDSFSYREPRSVVYRVSVAVVENTRGLSADAAEDLLTGSSIVPYNAEALQGHTPRQVTLGGAPAWRVDDLPVGPAGLTAHIVAVHNERVYEVLVEPHQLTGNQAEAFQAGAPSPANLALAEAIVATFTYTD